MLNRTSLVWALPVLALLPCSCGGGSGAPVASLVAPGLSPGAATTTLAVGVPPQLDGFFGLPDTLAIHGTSNSGVFLDLVSDPLRSASIRQPAHYTIIVPPGKTDLKVWVFDGNCQGLWDQNQLAYGAGDTVLSDGSAVEYRLTTDGTSGPVQLVALGESPRAAQGVGVTKVFSLDDEWEALYSGALPAAASAALANGSHRYSLDVKYVVDANDAINGYKLAVDGRIRLAPAAGVATVIGGFIGGVVDSREMNFNFPGNAPKTTYATSRDFYPNLLTPAASLNGLCTDASAFRPAVLHPAPSTFVNTYNGTFDVPMELAPADGQTWADFVQNSLILEEGDADDAFDTDPTAPAGTQNPGIPPDDGQPYPIGNPTRDSSGYRLPVAAAPSMAGSPYLEVIDPAGVVRATVHDLSGNVTQAPAGGSGVTQGWEKIPIPGTYEFDASNTTWTLRMHNLDARNTWFVRSNVKPRDFTPLLGKIGDRVWIDAQGVCNGLQDPVGASPTAEHGVNGVSVTLFTQQAGQSPVVVTPPAGVTWTNPQLTHDLGVGQAFQSPGGSFGAPGYYLFDKIPVLASGTMYVVQVDASNFAPGGPLAGTTRTSPATVPSSTTLSETKLDDFSLDFGYCREVTPQLGSIGDRVWADALGVCNGIQDPTGAGATAEHGVNGVSVTLFSQVGANLVAVTPPAGATWTNPQLTHDLGVGTAFQSPAGSFGTAGYYFFDKLPAPAAGATYVVQPDASNFLAGGALFGYDRTYPATSSSSTTLTQSKVNDFSLDFGYCKTVTPELGRIGDRVWADELNVCNGIQNPTGGGPTAEHGVNGVSVTLFTQVGANLVAVTPPSGATWTNPQLTHDLGAGQAFQSPAGSFGSAGYYLFDRLPAVGATYVVQVDASNFLAGGALFGYERTSPATSSSSTTLSQAKLDDYSLDFGYCKRESPGSIGDRVWADELNVCNGVQDAVGVGPTAEHGVNGVSVTLWSQDLDALSLVTPPAGATWTNPQLTHDLGVGQAFQSPGGAFGTAGYYLFDRLPAPAAGATYLVVVDASNFLPGGALFGYERTYPATSASTTTLSQTKLDDRSIDFGYCRRESPGSLGDRVWIDALHVCNGIQDPTGPGVDAEHGVNGVAVTLFAQVGDVLQPVTPPAGATWTNPQLTHDLGAGQSFGSPAGPFGAAGYYFFDLLPAPAAGATYVVQVNASNFLPGGPLDGYARAEPGTNATTLSQTNLVDLSLDFGYCKKECECQSGKVHELCVEASVWVGEACSRTLDVYVKLDRGCPDCPPDGSPSTSSTVVDLLTFSTEGPLTREQVGANGLITVKDVKTVDGYAKVLVCLDAKCPAFPGLYFDGEIHLEVVVNGVGEAFCAPVDCHCLKASSVFPCDWKPLWCDDVPDFHVWSFVPWECVPHEECKPPCAPLCPTNCDVPPTKHTDTTAHDSKKGSDGRANRKS